MPAVLFPQFIQESRQMVDCLIHLIALSTVRPGMDGVSGLNKTALMLE